MLGKAETMKGKLGKKSQNPQLLMKPKLKICKVKNLLKDGTTCLSKATAARKIQEIKAASAASERANAKLSATKKHQEKITTVKDVLGKRRKAHLEAVKP